ncbi:MAG: STAS domain-containing protein [Myxococcales bacterium]
MAREQSATERAKAAALAIADVATIRCEGEMGQFELEHLCDEIFRLTNRGRTKIVLDLTGVDHLDYRGLAPLAARARLLRKAGGDLKLAGLSAYTAALFRAAGVDEDFEMYENAEDAKVAYAAMPALAVVRR